MSSSWTTQQRIAGRVMSLWSPLHVRVYRASKGRIGARWSNGRMPLLLLTTTGRRSGLERTQPVGYVRDGERLVVVASYGGLPRHPSWFLNLRDDPDVTVELGGRSISMHAEVASGLERQRLWSKIVAEYPMFHAYQAAVTRQIPVVVLHPAEDAPPRLA